VPHKKQWMRVRHWHLLFLIPLYFTHQACFEEEFTASMDASLEFSLDTLRFDTVFTELGSATRSFRVYNNSDLSVRISKVRLERSNSFFRINVDGFLGPEIKDVEIRGRDSIWVFVEVTVDPDQDISSSPFVIEENLIFETNGNTQEVLLEAWGQNANYFPDKNHGNKVSLMTCDMGEIVWDDPKPYVIYGTLIIDSCTLVWPAGAQIYVHGGIADNQLGVFNDGILFTLPKGRIVSQGTLEEPVIVQDDRTEKEYSGLWGGLRFGPMSGPHEFTYTTIRNAVTAIGVDSAATLRLTSSVLHSASGSGLFARNARVTAVNSLFYDNASAGVALTFGGNYRFDYCTIASFGNGTEGLIVNNFYCSDPLCSQGALVTSIDASFSNTIIVGSAKDEILLVNAAPDLPEIRFDVQMLNCIVQVNELLNEDRFPDFFPDICSECIAYEFGDTLFVDPEMFNFHLDTLSIAEEKASSLPGIITDLDGGMRDPLNPDIGCYEFQ
jgi:Right handed beta helix region